MRTFYSVVFGGLLLLGSWLHADTRYNSSYCSQVSVDGVWAFSFADVSPAMNCQRATYSIQNFTWAPIHQTRTGYYQVNGWNRVYAQCRNYSQVFTGYGIDPLQRAYWATGQWGIGCLFTVN